MSWAEVFKINNNLKKAINEQITDREFNLGQIITSNTTYIVPKNGIYKVICVGAGENGSDGSGGNAGGVVVGKIKLTKNQEISISFNTNNSTNSNFGEIYKAFGNGQTGGNIADGYEGTIYNGELGTSSKGGSVGLFDVRYRRFADNTLIATGANSIGGDGLFGGKQPPVTYKDNNNILISYAGGAGGYGGGGSSANRGGSYINSLGGAGCVYIELIEEV